MKVLCLTVALCVVYLPGAAAVAAIYGWDGGSSSDNFWTTAGNWRGNVVPGCSSTGTDNIEIKAAYLVSPFNNTADWDYGSGNSCAYATVEILSNSSYAMTLKKSGAGTFNGGAMSLIGDSEALEAHLDVDDNMSASSLKTQSYTDIDVASGKTLDINGSFSVDAVSATSTCEKLAAGSMTPDTLYVKAGDAAGEHATFLISDGNVTASSSTDPLTSIEAAHTVDADATLQFNGTGDTYDPGDLNLLGGNPSSGGLSLFEFDAGTLTNPDTLNMYGLSKVDTQQSFTVAGNFTVTVNGGDTFATAATVHIASGQTVTVGTIQIGGSQACTLTLTGDSPGTLRTN